MRPWGRGLFRREPAVIVIQMRFTERANILGERGRGGPGAFAPSRCPLRVV